MLERVIHFKSMVETLADQLQSKWKKRMQAQQTPSLTPKHTKKPCQLHQDIQDDSSISKTQPDHIYCASQAPRVNQGSLWW